LLEVKSQCKLGQFSSQGETAKARRKIPRAALSLDLQSLLGNNYQLSSQTIRVLFNNALYLRHFLILG
jgi:hypothetical protein